MAFVDPRLARFVAELSDAYEEVCNRPEYSDDFFNDFMFSLKLYSYGDVAAKFYEDGIEFYPKEGK